MAQIDSDRISSLLDQARKGNRQAFSEIVRIMMNPITTLTYKMTQDRDVAMDLAQDTFVAAWQNLPGFKGESKFESWLYRIATNKSLNYIKRESRKTDDVAVDSTPDRHNVEHDFEKKELSQRIMAFMAQLPAQQRIVFELRFFKELSFDEVARVTEKAVGTVKTLYREAVKKLRHVAVSEGWY